MNEKDPHDKAALITLLQTVLEEVRIRKGPFSTIARTLESALQSGTCEDLGVGRIAVEYFVRYGEQYTLEELCEKRAARRNRSDEDAKRVEELQKWVEELLKKVAERARFGESQVPDNSGLEEFHPLSGRKTRHLLAKAPRRKPPRRKPRK
jgi:hypothetical protein